MAAELDMKPVKTKATIVWQRQILSFGARFLFGGSAVSSLRFSPETMTTEPATTQRQTCQMAPKGAICVIASPGVLEVGLKDRHASITAGPSDRAEVRLAGTRLDCEDK